MPRENRAAVRFPFALPLVFAFGLAACADDAGNPAPRQSMTSHFVAGTGGPGQPGRIETVVVDPLPVAAAMLKTADGQSIAATAIDRERNVYSDETGYGPSFGFGASGGSSSGVHTGFGFGFPLFGGGDGGVRTTTITTSTITFPVPDMAAYRRDWQHWILHLDLDDGANRRVIETLPPAPPPDPSP